MNNSNNGYFKYLVLFSTIFLAIASGTLGFSLFTNKRIDRLEDRILASMQLQYRMAADIDYIKDKLDGNSEPGNYNCFESDNNTFNYKSQPQPITALRTCYLILFNKSAEQKGPPIHRSSE